MDFLVELGWWLYKWCYYNMIIYRLVYVGRVVNMRDKNISDGSEHR